MSTDEVAEWLRRWTANPMCSARVGSNPILVGSISYNFSETSAHAKRFAEMVNIRFYFALVAQNVFQIRISKITITLKRN